MDSIYDKTIWRSSPTNPKLQVGGAKPLSATKHKQHLCRKKKEATGTRRTLKVTNMYSLEGQVGTLRGAADSCRASALTLRAGKEDNLKEQEERGPMWVRAPHWRDTSGDVIKVEQNRDNRDAGKKRFRLKWGVVTEPRKTQKTSHHIFEHRPETTKRELWYGRRFPVPCLF